MTFRTQEANFVAEEYTVKGVPLNRLGLMSDTPGMPRTQMPKPLVLPHQLELEVPDFRSDSPSPSIASSSSPIYPPSPVPPPNPDPQSEYCASEYCASPSYPQAPLPSKWAEADDNSMGIEIAKVSPMGRFLMCEDQIRALINQKVWVHGAVINTLGDFFCYTSCSQCRARCYKFLPTMLFDLWNDSTKDQAAAEASRCSHSACFKEVASLGECHAWLVPILLNNHWYLLALDWVDCWVRVYDSLAAHDEQLPLQLTKFSMALVAYTHEDFDLGEQRWFVIPEQVHSLMHGGSNGF